MRHTWTGKLGVLAVLAVASVGCSSNDGETQTNNDDPIIILVPEEGCQSNADCADDSAGPVCDMVTKECRAGCLEDADCAETAGAPFCDTSAGMCKPGCESDSDCSGDPGGPVCDTDAGRCAAECSTNADCEGSERGPVCNVEAGQCAAGCVTDAHCADAAGTPVCDTEINQCVAPQGGELLGTGDQAATVTLVHTPSQPVETPDLAFHPERGEIWLIRRRYEVDGECGQNSGIDRCRALPGYTTIILNPGLLNQEVRNLEDGNSWHFMRRPPTIAMGTPEYFATCGEAATGNFETDSVMFIGPTLWSTDFEVYAQDPGPGLNGSHLDMLHATPWCMGIAHERDNIYWTFNGHIGSIDKYDFKMDHGPGAADHSDGEIFRYVEGTLKRVPNVPSHMEFHDADNHLYVADTGNGRIVKLDTTSGTRGGRFSPVYEELADYGYMDDATLTDVVLPGMLEQPSGLAIHNDTLYVSDHATSTIHAFDMNGNPLRSLEVDLPAGSIAGIEVGPKGKLWFVDMPTGKLYRIDPPTE